MASSPEQLQLQLEEFFLEQRYAGAILLFLHDDPADYIDIITYIESTEEEPIDMSILHEDIGSLIRSSAVVYDVRVEHGLYRLTTVGETLAQTMIGLADEQIATNDPV